MRRLWLRNETTWVNFPKTVEKKKPPQVDLPWVDSSILSIFRSEHEKEGRNEPHVSGPYMVSFDLGWYRTWLAEQISEIPDYLQELLTESNPPKTNSLALDSPLYQIFMAIHEYVCKTENPSIDKIVESLVNGPASKCLAQPQNRPALRHLVFAILGWQSMLYRPSFNTCPLSELAIHEEVDQPNSKLIFDTFKLPAYLSDRPVWILLKGYGNLLPARSPDSAKLASEVGRSASTWNALSPPEMNAHLFQTLLNVEIRWVDTLAWHLDFDKSSRTLSIFRYPSLCLAMLQSKGAMYSFASNDLTLLDPRANFDEITDILHETLLSYRLLFGQSKNSRKLFRSQLKSNPALWHNPDSLLELICGRKHFSHSSVPPDRFTYFVPRDFLVLGERVDLLGTELREARPKNWKSLFQDRRDTTQYWTFWLVAIFGGASILLSLAQVILQAIQLVQET